MKQMTLSIQEVDTVDAPGDGAWLAGVGAGLYAGAWIWVIAC